MVIYEQVTYQVLLERGIPPGSWSCLINTKELSTFYFGCAAVVAVFPHSTIGCARVSHLPISLGQGQPWTYWLGDFISFHLKTAIAH